MSDSPMDELLRSAAGDDGSFMIPSQVRGRDHDDLIRAWSLERGHSIECEILLNLSRTAIVRFMAIIKDLTTTEMLESDNLIREIDLRLRGCPEDRA